MRITELRVQTARTINLGNFESLRIEAGVTASVDEADDLIAVTATMQAELRRLLEETYRAQHRGKESKA